MKINGPVENIREPEYGDSPNNVRIFRVGDTLFVELAYPNVTENGVTKIIIDQESVRATHPIRLSFDYSRDGWKVEQATRTIWYSDDPVCDPGWKQSDYIDVRTFDDERVEWERKLDEEEQLR